jgi:hypothetical protein
MTFLLSVLFLVTVVASLAAGVAAGYWVIHGFLNFFDPKRPRREANAATVMASTPSGD